MKKISLVFFIYLFLSVAGNNLKAQPPGPGGEDPPCWPPPCAVPIDGGLAFLLAAGLAYGGKKALEITKNKEQH